MGMMVEASAAGDPRVIPEALLLGILLGVLYDGFRILRTALGLRGTENGIPTRTGRLFSVEVRHIRPREASDTEAAAEKKHRGSGAFPCFLLDFLFMVLSGILFAVFLYWRNAGEIRWYLPAASVIGFFAYLRTAGVFVMRIASWVFAFLWAVLVWFYNHTLYYILNMRKLK